MNSKAKPLQSKKLWSMVTTNRKYVKLRVNWGYMIKYNKTNKYHKVKWISLCQSMSRDGISKAKTLLIFSFDYNHICLFYNITKSFIRSSGTALSQKFCKCCYFRWTFSALFEWNYHWKHSFSMLKTHAPCLKYWRYRWVLSLFSLSHL